MALTVLHSPQEWSAHFLDKRRAALSVGNFDGLHLGHQKLLSLLVEQARERGLRASVVTFDPHPLRLLRPEQAPAMIQTLSQRLARLEEMGVEAALVLQFNRELSQVSAEEFIEKILVDCLRAGTILVGANFCFGYRGAGDVQLLEKFGKIREFDVQIIPPVEIGGRVVSSTAVRNAIAAGNVAEAIPLLGRPFSLAGEITPGAQRGRTIQFPTLNLATEQELLPKLGVYATETVVEGNKYFSVTNVGTRPTFNGQGVTVESHLFNFNDQVTAGPMTVWFHTRIRDERKFSGADELRGQIAKDVATAKAHFQM